VWTEGGALTDQGELDEAVLRPVGGRPRQEDPAHPAERADDHLGHVQQTLVGLPPMAHLLRPIPPLPDHTRQGHSQFIWAHNFVAPWLFSAEKLTNLYRKAKHVNLRIVCHVQTRLMGLSEMALLPRPVPPFPDYTPQGLFQFIWVHGFGAPGIFPAEKLTDVYHRPQNVNLRKVRHVKKWLLDPPLPVRFRAKREHLKMLQSLTWKPRPESGLDCLTCPTFARQRLGQ